MECLDRSILERKDLTAARVFLEFLWTLHIQPALTLG